MLSATWAFTHWDFPGFHQHRTSDMTPSTYLVMCEVLTTLDPSHHRKCSVSRVYSGRRFTFPACSAFPHHSCVYEMPYLSSWYPIRHCLLSKIELHRKWSVAMVHTREVYWFYHAAYPLNQITFENCKITFSGLHDRPSQVQDRFSWSCIFSYIYEALFLMAVIFGWSNSWKEIGMVLSLLPYYCLVCIMKFSLLPTAPWPTSLASQGGTLLVRDMEMILLNYKLRFVTWALWLLLPQSQLVKNYVTLLTRVIDTESHVG